MRTTAKEIKAYLNENGIETKDIRVSTKSSINVKLLDPKLDYDKIDTLLREKYESYQRDEATGEILSGGNTFVFVEYDYNLVSEVAQALHGSLKPFLKGCAGRWNVQGLVSNYVDTQPLEYNVRITKRALYEAFSVFFKENPEGVEGLIVEGL